MTNKVVVENVNHPGQTSNVNADKYEDMKKALLKVLPKKAPGLTQKEMQTAVKAHLSDSLFPGGATSGWWVKCVQLDLEAKQTLTREPSKPLRWHRK